MATEELYLTAIDQNTVRVYTQVLLLFPFPDGTQAEAAICALTEGLDAALHKFPFLAGMLSIRDDESGRLTLTYPRTPDLAESEVFAWKIIPFCAKRFPHTYEQLKRAGMPPNALTGEIFRPDDLLNYAGIPYSGEGLVDFDKSNAPVMRMQANFIPNGLVLSSYIHHSVMDCSGTADFWSFLSYHVSVSGQISKSKKIPIIDPPTPPDQLQIRQELDKRAPTPTAGDTPSAEAYIDGKYEYPKTLPEGSPCEVKYLVIPASKIRDFRKRLKPHFAESSSPTIFNVLAALLWIHVTRARAARLGDLGDQETNVGVATDLRKRMAPQLGPSYMGNLALFSKGNMKIADIVSEDRVTDKTIIHVIREVQRTIAKVDNSWIEKHIAFFKSIKRIEDTECALGFRCGLDMYITSWMNFGADLQWRIPGTDLDDKSLGGRPEYIRRTYQPNDGGMMVMPRRRSLVNGIEAPYEIVVRLAEVDMDTFLAEEGGLMDLVDRVI